MSPPRERPVVEVRGFQDSDAPAVAKLWMESWASIGLSTPNDSDVECYRERLVRETWSIRVALIESEIVGFAAFQADDSWLRQLFVKPSFKRSGIGTILLERVKREMPAGLWLRTDFHNEAARCFYQARGLRFQSEEIDPIFGDRIAVYVWS